MTLINTFLHVILWYTFFINIKKLLRKWKNVGIVWKKKTSTHIHTLTRHILYRQFIDIRYSLRESKIRILENIILNAWKSLFLFWKSIAFDYLTFFSSEQYYKFERFQFYLWKCTRRNLWKRDCENWHWIA